MRPFRARSSITSTILDDPDASDDLAAEVDALEDEQFGERRGDELPPGVATREGRQRWLRDARSTPLRFSPTTSVPARPGRFGLASTGTAPGSRPGHRPGFPGHRPGIPRARRAHTEREPGHTSLQIKSAGAWPRSSDAGHARHGKEARWPQSLT